MWYVLTVGTFGNYWCGPFAEGGLREAVAAGHLRGDALLLDPNGRQITVANAFASRESGLATLGKLALAGIGIYMGAKVVGEVLQYLSDSPEQRSIRRSARAHTANGAKVCADHVGWKCTPPQLGHRRPDVYADYGTHVVVEEHETEASVGRPHSIDQDRDLRRWARRRSYVRYRQIVV